jgi:hypothetical protein
MIGWPSYLARIARGKRRRTQAPLELNAFNARTAARSIRGTPSPASCRGGPRLLCVNLLCVSIDHVLADLYETFCSGARCFLLFFAFTFTHVRRQNP